MELLTRLFKDEEGQGLIEYVLLLGLVVLVVIVSLGNTGVAVSKLWSDVKDIMMPIAGPTTPG